MTHSFTRDWISKIDHTNRILKLTNGSRLCCVGVENAEALRGRTNVSLLLLDEFQDYKQEMMSVLIPMITTANNPRIIKAGTAKSESNILYKDYLDALEKPNVSAYKIPITDMIKDPYCNFITEEKLDLI